MPTINVPEFDYYTYMGEHPPDPSQLQQGISARQQRREIAKEHLAICVDSEILEQFKQLVPDGDGYQHLINHALREWLAAQGVKELVREALHEMTAQVVSVIGKTAVPAGPQ